MKEKLESLQASGQTPRPKRQVGAWQTSEITPYSRIRDVQMIAMSSVRAISQQERDVLTEASQLVQAFEEEVILFLEKEWTSFLKRVEQTDIDWLGILQH